MAIAYKLLSFLVAIIILVGVHEFGHFYVARLCGVRVLRFSLGFGKVLWRKQDRLGTEYTLSAIPLGGYVKMLDEREGEVPPEYQAHTYNGKTVWQRMAIVLAGPVANFILAIVLFWGLLLQGERGLIPVVGKVQPGSVAAAAGLEPGQEILAVDGQPTPTEQQLERHLLSRLGESGNLSIRVAYPNSSLQYELHTVLDNWLRTAKDPDPIKGLGVELAFPVVPKVGEVTPQGPAARAGIQVGDLLVSVDQHPLKEWHEWVEYVRAHPGQALSLVVERQGQALTFSVTPESFSEKGVSYGRVGVGVAPPDEKLFRRYDYSVFGALGASLQRTWDSAGIVLLSVKKLLLGEISTKNLSGPISIANVAGSSAENGVKPFIGFLAMLSVFLGVFNLMPIPVLDGGQLAYLAIEVIRGKPVSEKMQVLGYQIGLMLVIGLSVLAMYNDIMRL